MAQQRTLRDSIRSTGIGLHTGRKVLMVLRPAPPNTGIVFRRTDLEPPVDIPARATNVTETTLGTTLAAGEAGVSTVEHLMSALAGLGIDNLFVELTAGEVPIMDGSAGPFVFLIQSAGIELQNSPKRFVRVRQPVEVREGDKWARFEPYEGFRINFEIEFDHPVFHRHEQRATMDFSTTTFLKEVSRARTFGFMRDMEYLRGRNLALGGTLDNAIVLDDYRILNEDGLRFEDEFVRHKILDAIGDLYLLGHSLDRRVHGFQVGAWTEQPAAARNARGRSGLGRSHVPRRQRGAYFLRGSDRHRLREGTKGTVTFEGDGHFEKVTVPFKGARPLWHAALPALSPLFLQSRCRVPHQDLPLVSVRHNAAECPRQPCVRRPSASFRGSLRSTLRPRSRAATRASARQAHALLRLHRYAAFAAFPYLVPASD